VYNLIGLYFLRVVIKLVLIFFVLVIENQVSQSKGIYVFFFFNFIVATDSCIIAEAAGKAHVNEHWNPFKLLFNLQIRLGLIVRCSWVGWVPVRATVVLTASLFGILFPQQWM